MRSRIADAAILVFLVTQALDGALTYFGIMGYGVGIEGNPIVANWIHLAGPVGGLYATKLLATVCGLVLYFHDRTKTLIGLTALYLAAAVVPWSALLFTPAIR